MTFKTKSDISHGFFVLLSATAVGVITLLLGLHSWIVLIAAGFAFTAYGVYNLYQLIKTRNWKKTTGIIKSAVIGEFLVSESEYSRRTYYYPEVAFSYEVEGRQFESDTIAADLKSHWSANKTAVENILTYYAPGETATVYYNPRKPNKSVLLPGLSRYRISHFSAIIIGGFLLASAGYGIAIYG